MAAKKSKSSGEAERDSGGRWKKGQSGNPRGRAKLPPEFKHYAAEAPERLRAIADDPDTPVKVKADIERWFAEMLFGKKKADADSKADKGESVQTVRFEGVLEEWSQ